MNSIDKEKNIIVTNWISKKIRIPTDFVCIVIEERERSIKVSFEDREIWIPKSQILSSGANTIYHKNGVKK